MRPLPKSLALLNVANSSTPMRWRAGNCTIALSRLAPASKPVTRVAARIRISVRLIGMIQISLNKDGPDATVCVREAWRWAGMDSAWEQTRSGSKPRKAKYLREAWRTQPLGAAVPTIQYINPDDLRGRFVERFCVYQ